MEPRPALTTLFLLSSVVSGQEYLMEETDWRPVGRGDPLRDPTNEYVPPLLERVRYWLPQTTTPAHDIPQTQQQSTPSMENRRRDQYLHHHFLDSRYYYRPKHPSVILEPPPSSSSADMWLYTPSVVETTSPVPSILESLLRSEIITSTPRPFSLPTTEATTSAISHAPMTTVQVSPSPVFSQQASPEPTTPTTTTSPKPTYVIIQGHSKVKKYGTSELDAENLILYDFNHVQYH